MAKRLTDEERLSRLWTGWTSARSPERKEYWRQRYEAFFQEKAAGSQAQQRKLTSQMEAKYAQGIRYQKLLDSNPNMNAKTRARWESELRRFDSEGRKIQDQINALIAAEQSTRAQVAQWQSTFKEGRDPRSVGATSTAQPRQSLRQINEEPAPGGLKPPEAPTPATDAAVGGAEEVRQLQRDLNTQGANLVVDGVMGPKTRAAMGQAQGGATTGAAGAALAPRAPRPSAGQIEQQVAEEFPEYLGFLKIPELGGHIADYVAGAISEQELQKRMRDTAWWKTTNATQRQWLSFVALDPATAESLVQDGKAQVRKFADEYLVQLSDERLTDLSRQLLSGTKTGEQLKVDFAARVTSRFPGLAGTISGDASLKDYIADYQDMAAKELEISPEQIDLNDPKWTRFLEARDDQGRPKTMTLYEWQQALRSDPIYGWDRTSRARTEAAGFITELNRRFGAPT